MRCLQPFRSVHGEFGCGQCRHCRVLRARQKTGRLIAEALTSPISTFFTLTYSDEHLPPELEPKHTQDFLKRLRRELEPRTIRYFLCGEYGEQTYRPHYHGIFFGMSPTERETIAKAWGKGFVHTGTVTPESCGYVAGYVLKKITDPSVPEELQKLRPAFQRSSLRPGIGARACDTLAQGLMSHTGSAGLAALGDIPTKFVAHGKTFPLDRYLKAELRQRVGWDKKMPALKQAQIAAEREMETLDQIAMRHKRTNAARIRESADIVLQRSKRTL